VATTTGGRARRKSAGAGASGSAARARTTTESPRTGAKRTVVYYMKQLPAYLRLLGGLITDRRVSAVDKLLVAGAMAYIALPVDFIPDFIPFIGEVDDVFILVMALQRLVANAGRNVLVAHWTGALEDLQDLNLKEALAAAAFFLPRGIRRRLKVIGRG
jgi:uncharacterized membrane protein YkvA (DUF1232 family)